MGTIWQPELETDKGPKYKAVANAIRAGIVRGNLKESEKLPPVRELAWQLGITPGTVARAYTILTDQGVLRAEVGRGTFVAGAGNPQAALDEKPPIEVDVVQHGNELTDINGPVSLFSPHLPAMGQTKLIREKLAELAISAPSGLMHYPDRNNTRPARASVVQWLKGTPLGSFNDEHVVLTNGGQNAVSLVMQAVLNGRRPTVLVEELSYLGFRRAAELLRANVVPVAMDEQGIIPEALDAAARAYDAQILCTSPEVHNPTGLYTPTTRRHEIMEVARKCDFQILEDDCYRMGIERAPSYRMLAPERGWYVSSIAKTITPSLRFGFIVAPEGQEAKARRAAEFGFFGLATPLADLCAALLTDERIEAVVDRTRHRLNDYIRSAVNILGGYDLVWREDVSFLWLRLPVGWRAGAFCQAAGAQGVQIRSAEEYASREARTLHAVRLAINAGVSLEHFENAIERLRHLLDNPPESISV